MDFIKSIYTKPPSLKIILEKPLREPTILYNLSGDLVEYPTFYDPDPIQGKVLVELNKNKNFDHTGIKIELYGLIENYKDKRLSSRFIALTRDLEAPGKLDNEITQFPFEFSNVEKQYETYRGKNIGVRYYLQTTLSSSYKNLYNEYEIVIIKPKENVDDENNPRLQMDVGIEDWLHVAFDINKTKYFLKDIIIGEVTFKNVSLRLQSMEVQLLRRETVGAGVNAVIDNSIISKFEIMDGAPTKFESIPIRMFLRAFKGLTPTYTNVNNKFSVQYLLNLVITDVDDRRYFKQMEIFLVRRCKHAKEKTAPA